MCRIYFCEIFQWWVRNSHTSSLLVYLIAICSSVAVSPVRLVHGECYRIGGIERPVENPTKPMQNDAPKLGNDEA